MAGVKNKTFVIAYVLLGLLTLCFQVYVRLQECTGPTNCATSLGKGFVWSIVWPASWVAYGAGME